MADARNQSVVTTIVILIIIAYVLVMTVSSNAFSPHTTELSSYLVAPYARDFTMYDVSSNTINIPSLGDVNLSDHAVDQHGMDAVIARCASAVDYGKDGRYDCDDKHYIIRKVTRQNSWVHSVTIVSKSIINGVRSEITSFLCSDDKYLETVMRRDNCVKAN